jgi:hypothetical protein
LGLDSLVLIARHDCTLLVFFYICSKGRVLEENDLLTRHLTSTAFVWDIRLFVPFLSFLFILVGAFPRVLLQGVQDYRMG